MKIQASTGMSGSTFEQVRLSQLIAKLAVLWIALLVLLFSERTLLGAKTYHFLYRVRTRKGKYSVNGYFPNSVVTPLTGRWRAEHRSSLETVYADTNAKIHEEVEEFEKSRVSLHLGSFDS